MNIPYFNTDKPECGIVCLQMALAYYGFPKDLEDLYAPVEAIGEQHSILPWGICLAAESFGLYSILISEKPCHLSKSSKKHIMQGCNICGEKIDELVSSQIERVENSDKIDLFHWKNEYRILPEKIVKTEQGVVIPFIQFGLHKISHAIVITKYTENSIYYNNPTEPDVEKWSYERSKFEYKWLHPDFDKKLNYYLQ